jgi:RND superfamily putative drug exporter
VLAWLGRLAVRRPWLVIGAWVAGSLAVVAVSPSLAEVTSSNQLSFLPGSDESVRALDALATYFPEQAGASGVLVVERSDGARLGDADVARVQDLATSLSRARLEAVTEVVSSPALVSPDRRLDVVQVFFRGQPGEPQVNAAVGRVRALATSALTGTGLEAGLTGNAAIQVDTSRAFATAQTVIALATILLIVALLVLIFRSPVVALLPIVVIGLVHAVATSAVAGLAKLFGFQVSDLVTPLLVVVLFGVGTDYVVFLLYRYRERLVAGEDRAEALVFSARTVGEVVASSAFTVIAAFAALLLSVLGTLRTLAPGLIVSVALMLVAALTLVPAAVSVLGPALFWPVHPHASSRTTFSEVMGRLVARRPWAVVAVYGGALVLLSLGALAYRANYNQVAELPTSSPSVQAYHRLERSLPAGALGPTQVVVVAPSPLEGPGCGVPGCERGQALSGLESRLRSLGGVAAVLPAQLDPSRRAALLTVVLDSDPYSPPALDLAGGRLREAVHGSVPGARVLVGGTSSTFADVRRDLDRDVKVVFPVAAAVIAVILAGVLRSLVAPLYLLAGTGLGYLATLGASVLVFQKGAGLAGLDFTIPIVLYLFVAAIGTDYNILMAARLREEFLAGQPARRAALAAVAHGGPTVAAAGLVLAGTFASLMLTDIVALTQLGFGVAVGIAISAFVMAPRLVPSVAAIRGWRFWWPGSLHARVGPPSRGG